MMIFNIQRFSIHDGDGIRTVVFFKGCPLRCAWCSNPESHAAAPEPLFDPDKCIGCRDCAKAAPDLVGWSDDGMRLERSPSPGFARLRNVCPAEALSIAGEELTAEAILDVVEKDKSFYRGKGGVTLSGGEPFAQPAAALELLRLAKERDLVTGVETCLAVPWRSVEPCLPYLDFIYADVKHVDAEKYRRLTGGDVSVPLANLRHLADANAPVSARLPVIPGFNNDPADLTAIARFVAGLGNVKKLHLIPYHSFGAGKYRLLGREYVYAGVPSTRPESLAWAKELVETFGLVAHIGG